jgi:hypothetical protein
MDAYGLALSHFLDEKGVTARFHLRNHSGIKFYRPGPRPKQKRTGSHDAHKDSYLEFFNRLKNP